ncbi:MAG TPA: restriction endonuclease subunit S, partial [Polyangium sp.]|nr:restriction endonuclease subunit S [Polyangium sp.]
MIDELTNYPTYKASGVPWVDEVPTHWSMLRGKTLFAECRTPAHENDEIVTCFRDGQVTLRRNRRTRGFVIATKEIGYQHVQKGQLVVNSVDAAAGAVGVSDSDGKCADKYLVCTPQRPEYVPDYFSWTLRVMAQMGFIASVCESVAGRPQRLRYSTFAQLQLPVPPIEEQQAIVQFLNSAGHRLKRYIAAQMKLLALLEEQKNALVLAAVTRGHANNVPLRQINLLGVEQIPAHWSVIPARHLFRAVTRRDVRSDDIEVRIDRSGTAVPTSSRLARASSTTQLAFLQLCHPGDLVIGKFGTPRGSAWAADRRALVTSNYTVLEPRVQVDSRYVALLYRTLPYVEMFRRAAHGGFFSSARQNTD